MNPEEECPGLVVRNQQVVGEPTGGSRKTINGSEFWNHLGNYSVERSRLSEILRFCQVSNLKDSEMLRLNEIGRRSGVCVRPPSGKAFGGGWRPDGSVAIRSHTFGRRYCQPNAGSVEAAIQQCGGHGDPYWPRWQASLHLLAEIVRRGLSAGCVFRCRTWNSACQLLNSWSSALASFRSVVSKPSVNQL